MCVNEVSEWMLVNKLKLNEDKTEVMLCNPKKIDIDPSIDSINICNFFFQMVYS